MPSTSHPATHPSCATCTAASHQKGSHFHPFIPWMAPKLMQHLTTSYTCDVHSFGVLAWEVWEGEEPWAGLSLKDVWRLVVIEGQRLPIQGNHITLAPLLEKCLRSPSQRVSITEVVSKLLSVISDQSICHHYSQEKIA